MWNGKISSVTPLDLELQALNDCSKKDIYHIQKMIAFTGSSMEGVHPLMFIHTNKKNILIRLFYICTYMCIYKHVYIIDIFS